MSLITTVLLLFAAHAAPDGGCAGRLEIPRVKSSELKVESGSAYLARCREVHARVGPIFSFQMIPGCSILKPALRIGRHLPEFAGGATFAKGYDLMRDLSGTAVHVSSPKLFAALIREDDAFARFYATAAMDFRPTLGRGGILLLPTDDELWTRTHDALAPHFTRRRSRDYLDVIVRTTRDSLEAHRDGTGDLRLADFAQFNTMTIIHRILFGESPPIGLSGRLVAAMSDAWRGRVPPGERYTAFRVLLTEYLERARLSPDAVAAQLLGEAKSFPKDWWLDQIVTLYFAGADTTRSLLTHALIELAGHPDWQTRLRSVDADRDATAFVRETSRLHPVVGMLQRRVTRDVNLGPYLVKRGTFLQIDSNSLHLSAYDHPDRFDPDRFITTNHPPLSLCPYGLGRRVCLGQHLANFEVETVLKTVVRAFELEAPLEPIERDKTKAGPFGAAPEARLRLRAR